MNHANSNYVHPPIQTRGNEPLQNPASSPGYTSSQHFTEVYHDENSTGITQHQLNSWKPDTPTPRSSLHTPASSNCNLLGSTFSQSTPLPRQVASDGPLRRLDNLPISSPIKKIGELSELGTNQASYDPAKDPVLDLIDPALPTDPHSEPNFKFVFEKQGELEKSGDVSLDEDLSDIEQFYESQVDSSVDANYSSIDSSFDEASDDQQNDQDVASLGVPLLSHPQEPRQASGQPSNQPSRHPSRHPSRQELPKELQLPTGSEDSQNPQDPQNPQNPQGHQDPQDLQDPENTRDPRINAILPPVNVARVQPLPGQSYNAQLMHLEEQYTQGRISQRMLAVNEIDRKHEEQQIRNKRQSQQANQRIVYGLGVHDPGAQPLNIPQFQLPVNTKPAQPSNAPRTMKSEPRSSPYIPQSPYEYQLLPQSSPLCNPAMFSAQLSSPMPMSSPYSAMSPYSGLCSPPVAQNQQFYGLNVAQETPGVKDEPSSENQMPSSSSGFEFLETSPMQNQGAFNRDLRCPSTPPPLPQLYDRELKQQTMIMKRQNNIRSSSKIPLHMLFSLMGINDPYLGKHHEEYIMRLLQEEGFKLGYQTWVRDTSLAERRKIVDNIHCKAAKLGYCRDMIELIIRRGSYCRMQCKLRKVRRFTQQRWDDREYPVYHD